MRLAPALALFLALPAAAQIHVSASAPPGGDGTTWATAYASLDDALSVATAGQRVWVARGVYVPTVERVPGDPRTRSFVPARGVRLFGGFAGHETLLADRAGLVRETVLDGDLGVPGLRTDNAYNVVRLEGNGAVHVVDGFTIRNGYADGAGLERGGGAIATQLGTKRIQGCDFEANYGRAGGALLEQLSILQVVECTFRGNGATERGGAAYVTRDTFFEACLFDANITRGRGGAVFTNQGALDLEDVPLTSFQNCVFRANVANVGGAAFVADPPGPVVAGRAVWSGCAFLGNTALQSGAAIGTPPEPTGVVVDVANSIVWDNLAGDRLQFAGHPLHIRTVAYSIVTGGWPGPGVLTSDPFLGPQGEPGPGSPATDAGANDLVLRDRTDRDGDGDPFERTPLDRSGWPRRSDDPTVPDAGSGGAPVVDIGPYERN